MKARVEVIDRNPVREAGHPRADALPEDEVLFQGLATALPPRRDWEQVAALEGTYALGVYVRTPRPLDRATHARVEGEDYEVASAERQGRMLWLLRLRRRP